MARPTIALRQWIKLRQSLSRTPHTPLNSHANFLAPSANLLVLTRHTPSSKRLFHNTRAQNAKRIPPPAPEATMRRDNRQGPKWFQIPNMVKGSGAMNRDGFFLHSLGTILNPERVHAWYKDLQGTAGYEYDNAIRAGALPKAISFKTFKTVKLKLADASFTARPNAQAIRAISVDVDTVFRIGYCATPFDHYLRDWIVSSCAMAKARIPLVLVTNRGIDKQGIPVRTEWTTAVEKLAAEKFPPALLLHAKILSMRGHHQEACELLEKEVLPFTTSTQQPPQFFEDITLSGILESPWRLYALLQAQYDEVHGSPEARRKSDEAIRISATVYQDPDAMVDYAIVMMNENNLDLYEEYMLKAATAGNANACMFLANFYYLTFHGRYPTRGERAGQIASQGAETSNPKAASSASSAKEPSAMWKWITSFFRQSMKREEYRSLASDWYYLAYTHGNRRASLMMALLAREDGDLVNGLIFLEQAQAEKDRDFAGKLEALKANWNNKDYVPKLPRKILDVQ